MKDIDIKIYTYYFSDIINIKFFDLNNIIIDEKSQKIFQFTIFDM